MRCSAAFRASAGMAPSIVLLSRKAADSRAPSTTSERQRCVCSLTDNIINRRSPRWKLSLRNASVSKLSQKSSKLFFSIDRTQVFNLVSVSRAMFESTGGAPDLQPVKRQRNSGNHSERKEGRRGDRRNGGHPNRRL